MNKFIHYRTWHYHIHFDAYYDSAALRALLGNPDQVLQPGCELLKNDLKTTVGLITIDGRRLVIKRYNIINHWHALKRCLSRSRASICWQAAQRLAAADIATPPPVAMIEKRYGLLKSTSYYIHEYVAGMHAGDYFTALQKQPTWEIVAARIAELVRHLLANKLSHGDMKVTNIIITDQKPILIDLDDTQQHIFKQQCLKAVKKDLRRFMKHWHNNAVIKKLFAKLFQLKET